MTLTRHYSLAALCLLLGISAGPVCADVHQQAPRPQMITPLITRSALTSGEFHWAGVTPLYGTLTREASFWPHPAKVGARLQFVEPGQRVRIVGTQKGFFAAILESGRHGWLPCDAVRSAFTGPGLPPLYGILTREASLWRQPAKVGPRIQFVSQGRKVRLIGTRAGFFAAYLSNGVHGWLPCDAVQFGPIRP